MLLLQLGALLLSTCVVFIEAGEQGLLERFGKPVESRSLLGPGAHLKLPWPMDQVYRFRTEQIQTFTVGFARRGSERSTSGIVLWSQGHRRRRRISWWPTASRLRAGDHQPGAGKRTPPVSLLTVSVPVQFQITNLVEWAYNNEDAPTLLEDSARAKSCATS